MRIMNNERKLLRKIKNIVETGKMTSSAFDWIAGTFLYRKFIYSRINEYSQLIKKNREHNVIIETTSLCNARCVMCPHVKMKRKMEVMNDFVFALIVEKLKNEKINPPAFILNGFGDPLTDTKIFDRIQILKKEFPQSVLKFYSNLGMANEITIKNMLGSGLDELNVSFNGYDKENYEKTMGISYQRTLDNLKKLIQAKKRFGSRLKIRISMTLVSNNDGDEKKFLREWRGKVDSVSVNKVHTYASSVEDMSGKNKINFNKKAYPCKYLWDTIVFGVDGSMFLCCLDFEGRYNFGNIGNSGILEIFYSDKFEKIRQRHLAGKIEDMEICSRCYTPYKNGAEWLIKNLY